jgi:leader peptidase (prepilin peptidase)/N-methyltransferase
VNSPAAVLAVGSVGLVAGAVINLTLRRSARECSAITHMWRRYFAVELLAPILYVALTVRFGFSVQLPAYLYLASIGLLLAMIDFDVRRLPDSIVLPSYVMTALLLMPAGAAQGDWGPAQRALAGLAAFAALFFALTVAYPHAVGYGDVKLAGLFGMYLAWLSWGTVLIGLLSSFMLVGFGGVVLGGGRRTGAQAIPFAPCLILTSVLALFVTVPIGTWYGSILGHA